jgi:ubiquinol-cytochrome c reductase cytochrome b subunit
MMAGEEAEAAVGNRKLRGALAWMDARLPLSRVWNEQWGRYYAPKNLNLWYVTGSLLLFIFVMQFVSGVFLTMSYKPDAEKAFQSVEYIMRDVEWGWLIRYAHSTGASAFFVVSYLHMFRSLLYGSHRRPRELLWILGMLIYLVLMAEAFFGYLLPWGNMSYWGAQVIVSLFGTVPVVGTELSEWIRGDFFISDVTLNRFFALHVVALPTALALLVVLHLMALHEVGSNNPDGIDIRSRRDADGKPLDGVPSHPYYTVKDLMALAGFLAIFTAIVLFAPTFHGLFLEAPNFEIANPMQTPAHISPVWYFTPFYAMLRAVPAFMGTPVWGAMVMAAAVVVPIFLPWLDRAPVRSIRYRGPIYRVALVLFAINFLVLGYCGLRPAVQPFKSIALAGTLYYFAFFLLLPWYSRIDRCTPEPDRVTSRGR